MVQNDSQLKDHVQIVDGVPYNVLSVGRAKGCEYPEVVLYKFGELAGAEVFGENSTAKVMDSLPQNEVVGSPNPDQTLPLQYYINRVYVGVSRPKRRLIIVDTERGFSDLWQVAMNPSISEAVLKKVKHGEEVWESMVEGMTNGQPEDVTRESAANPREIAIVFEADGLARHDSYHLLQAALNYKAAGDMAKYRECRAHALKEEGSFLEAGNAYLEAGFVPKAVDCLWRAGRTGWARIREILADQPQIRSDIEVQWAIALERPSLDVAEDNLIRLADRLAGDATFAESFTANPAWQDALTALIQPLVSSPSPAADEGLFQRICVALDAIAKKGVTLQPLARAQVYFSAALFADAIRIWDTLPEQLGPLYAEAKTRVEPYPARVVWLDKLRRTEDIVRLFDSEPSAPLTDEQANAVTKALCENGRCEDAMRVAWSLTSSQKMLELTLAAHREQRAEAAQRGLQAGIYMLAMDKQWHLLAALATSKDFVPAEGWRGKRTQEWLQSETESVKVALVRALSRADGLEEAPEEHLRMIQEFLRVYLNGRGRKWQGVIREPEAGAALERAGRFTDALVFYEAVMDGADDKLTRFCLERRLVCKQRQSKYEDDKGNYLLKGDLDEDIVNLKRSLAIESTGKITQYPELEKMKFPEIEPSRAKRRPSRPRKPRSKRPEAQTSSRDQRNRINAGHLELEWSRSIGRCNITHRESRETACIKVHEGQPLSVDVDFRQTSESHWYCEAWDLDVDIIKGEGAGVTLSSKKFKRAIVFSL